MKIVREAHRRVAMHESESLHPADFQITPTGRNRHGLIVLFTCIPCFSSFSLLSNFLFFSRDLLFSFLFFYLLFFFFSLAYSSSCHQCTISLNQPNQDYTHSSIRKEKKKKAGKEPFESALSPFRQAKSRVLCV